MQAGPWGAVSAYGLHPATAQQIQQMLNAGWSVQQIVAHFQVSIHVCADQRTANRSLKKWVLLSVQSPVYNTIGLQPPAFQVGHGLPANQCLACPVIRQYTIFAADTSDHERTFGSTIRQYTICQPSCHSMAADLSNYNSTFDSKHQDGSTPDNK